MVAPPERVPAEPGEFTGPEPPPPGSAAYRRVILSICATHDLDDFDALMRPVFEWRGWRAAVDVMTELTGAMAYTLGRHMLDAFGKVRTQDHIIVMEEEWLLRQAHALAPRSYPDLPPHEALAAALRDGEETRELCLSLVPAWDEAASMLRTAETLEEVEPARAVFTRWLNAHYRDRRNWAAILGAQTTHAHWRHRVMPPGDEWIDDLLEPSPDLRGSVSWANTATLVDVRQQQPVDGYRPQAGPVKAKVKGKKRQPKCCPGCGKKRR